jgi:hypothetical protein
MAARAILDEDENFDHSLTFREQCARAFQILRVDQGERFSLRLVASLLSIRLLCKVIGENFKKWGNERQDGGRLAILPPEVMDQLVIAITTARYHERPLSLHQIRAMIDQNSHIQIRPDTLYHALFREEESGQSGESKWKKVA